MNVFQSAPLVNEVASEMWGQSAPKVKTIGDLVTLGEKVLSSDDNKEGYLSILVDRIKRTVLRKLDVSVEMPKILLDNEAYFGILQKINIAPLVAKDDNSWNVGKDDYATTIWEINKPNISQTFFNSLSTFTIPVTIPDVMLKSAFINGEMDTFITAIFSSIETALVMYINALTHMALSNLIAERVKANKKVNVLALYNSTFSKTLTVATAMYDKEFLRFAGMLIRNYIGYMKNPSVLYNDGTQLRATDRDNMHVIMLNDFVSAYTTYFSSDTFHNELASLPLYSELSYWQFVGNTVPNFANNSSINVIPASEEDANSPTAVEQSGIICVLADRQSIGVTLTEDWSAVDRNNRERYSNYTFGANRGYFNDLSENAVVFVLEDVASENAEVFVLEDVA